jgi:hypothetical protein
MPDAPADVDSRPIACPTPIHPRLSRAEQLSAVTAAQHQGQSHRAAIAAVGVPRRTASLGATGLRAGPQCQDKCHLPVGDFM